MSPAAASPPGTIRAPPLADPEIAGLTADSRQVKPGFLFAALRGVARDGREFAGAAVAQGAVAIEASSHGLAQFRLDGVDLAAAAFTNLTRDHLDYHGDMDTYRAAKERLFTDLLSPEGPAILNADSAEFGRLANLCREHGHPV